MTIEKVIILHHGAIMKLSRMFSTALGTSLVFLFCCCSPAHALTIQLDYTYDVADAYGGGSFFSQNALAKAALERAAADLGAAIGPTLGAVPTDVFSSTNGTSYTTFDWRLMFMDPATGSWVTNSTFSFATDTVTVYVGMRALGTNNDGAIILGEGSPVQAAASVRGGDENGWPATVADAAAKSNAAMMRGGGPVTKTYNRTSTNGSTVVNYSLSYGAMGGTLWFDNDSNNDGQIDTAAVLDSYWHFDYTTAVGTSQTDFYTVALHELMHTIGFGTSQTWNDDRSGTNWLGSRAVLLNYGSGVGLVTTNGHIREGYSSERLSDGVSQEAVMDPSVNPGTRKMLTWMDTAFLRDIGYSLAGITSPADGNVLSSDKVTFNWQSIAGATQYELTIGSAVKSHDYYAGIEGTNLSRTLRVPATGSNIHVWLGALVGETWQPVNYYSYTTASPLKAAMMIPTNGSTNSSLTMFTWNAGVGASQYALWVGSASNSYDLAALNVGTNQAQTLKLPVIGSNVYVRLWSLINGDWPSLAQWQYSDYCYLTPSPEKAAMTGPLSGATNGSNSMTLNWTAGIGPSQYALWVGSTSNSYDLYAQAVGTNLSQTINGLPVDGRTLYVRLWSLMNGDWPALAQWQYTNYSYRAFNAMKARFAGLANGATLGGTNVTLNWDAGAGVSQYALWVGSTAGTYDLYAANVSTNLSGLLTGLPADGRRLYVRLWSLINGAWKQNDYEFKAFADPASQLAQMISPTNGATLVTASTNFTWSRGTNVSMYALWEGSAPGDYDLNALAVGTNQTQALNVPLDGGVVYVRLWSLVNGTWKWNDYEYGTGLGGAAVKAQMTSHASGATLDGAATTFGWNAGAGVSMYALWVGTMPGSYDLYAAALGSNRTQTVTGLPVDGGPVYVRLWSLIGGAWKFNDYFYSAYLAP